MNIQVCVSLSKFRGTLTQCCTFILDCFGLMWYDGGMIKARATYNYHVAAFDRDNWVTVIADNRDFSETGFVSYSGEPPVSDEQLGRIARIICGQMLVDDEAYNVVIGSPEGTILYNDRELDYPLPRWVVNGMLKDAIWEKLELGHDDFDFMVKIVKGKAV